MHFLLFVGHVREVQREVVISEASVERDFISVLLILFFISYLSVFFCGYKLYGFLVV